MISNFLIKNLVISAFASLLACAPKDKETHDELKPSNPEDRFSMDGSLVNFDEIVTKLDLRKIYQAIPANAPVPSIAIFDNGYDGLEYSLGTRLPPDIRVEPVAKGEAQGTIHGTRIAELVYAVASGSPLYSEDRRGPEMSLYVTNGLTNLEAAIDAAIAANVTMIVYAQTWEYGGNLDGKGFINKLFDRALDRGIKVVAAVGNYGKSAMQQSLEFNNRGQVKFANIQEYINFTVAENQTPVKISLGWNDFRDSIEYRTPQDLNLVLLNSDGSEIIEEKMTIQDGLDHGDDARYSRHAREVIQRELSAGTYRLRVSARNPKQFKRESRMWLAINGYGVILESSKPSNTVFIPADNPRVFSVGANDVAYTSSSKSELGPTVNKPDTSVPSVVIYNNGDRYDGSSAAAAIAAGKLAALTRMQSN